MWYKTGTVAVATNSTQVSGTGSDFVLGAKVGDGFQVGTSTTAIYEIQSVQTGSLLTLTTPFLGPSVSGSAYAIIPTQSLTADLTTQVIDLINNGAGSGTGGNGGGGDFDGSFSGDDEPMFVIKNTNKFETGDAPIVGGVSVRSEITPPATPFDGMTFDPVNGLFDITTLPAYADLDANDVNETYGFSHLSGDGLSMVYWSVEADQDYWDDNNGGTTNPINGTGRAKMLERTAVNQQWTEKGTPTDLIIPVPTGGELVGAAISTDGNTVAFYAVGPNTQAEQFSAYEYVGGAWVQKGTTQLGTGVLLDSDVYKDRELNTALAMSGDGLTCVVSNYDAGAETGLLEVYHWDTATSDWHSASTAPPAGMTVDISADGSTIIIGNQYREVTPAEVPTAGGYKDGMVEVWQVDSPPSGLVTAKVWTVKEIILGEYEYYERGSAVSISSDGSRICFGEQGCKHTYGSETGDSAGAVHVMDWNATTGAHEHVGNSPVIFNWTTDAYGVGSGEQGVMVAISPDGSKFVSGGSYDSRHLPVMYLEYNIWKTGATGMLNDGSSIRVYSYTLEYGYSLTWADDSTTLLFSTPYYYTDESTQANNPIITYMFENEAGGYGVPPDAEIGFAGFKNDGTVGRPAGEYHVATTHPSVNSGQITTQVRFGGEYGGLHMNARGDTRRSRYGDYGVSLYRGNSNEAWNLTMSSESNYSYYPIMFFNGSAQVGSIKTNTSMTQFLTSSDARLKKNIVDSPESGSVIDAIQVRSHDWIAPKTRHVKYGLIAQELFEVYEGAVAGDPNGDLDDEDGPMGVDTSHLVPLLIKELQTLRARVAQLEANQQ